MGKWRVSWVWQLTRWRQGGGFVWQIDIHVQQCIEGVSYCTYLLSRFKAGVDSCLHQRGSYIRRISAKMSTADARVEAAHTYLLLPFTTDILADPSPLLRTIYNASLSSQQSCALIFCSPKESSRKGIGGQQLYNILKASPRRHWSAFQLFLGKVYAALAAGQWEAGKVLMDVEVQFDEDGSRHEDWERRLLYAGKGVGRVLLLEGAFSVQRSCNHRSR